MLIDGGLHAQTIRLEGDIGSCAVNFSGITSGGARTDWTGFGIEHCFAGGAAGIDARFAGGGAAIGAGELAGLPRPAIDLAVLKLR
jgi:hypothetical protein